MSEIRRNYKAIADAIREMLGTSTGITPNDMPANILNISGGGTIDDQLDITSENAVQNKVITAAFNEIINTLDNLDGSIEVLPGYQFSSLTEAQKDAIWDRVVEYIEPESGEQGRYVFHPFMATNSYVSRNQFNLFFYHATGSNPVWLTEFKLEFNGYEIVRMTDSGIRRDDGPWESGEEPLTKYTIFSDRDSWQDSGIVHLLGTRQQIKGYAYQLQPGDDFNPNPWTIEAYIRACLQNAEMGSISDWAYDEDGKGSTVLDKDGNSYSFVCDDEYPENGITAYVVFWLTNNENTQDLVESGDPAFKTYKVSISSEMDPDTGDLVEVIGTITEIEPTPYVSGTHSNGNWTTITIGSDTYAIPTGGSSVSGTTDGTNWTSITIDGTTKNIPAGGGGGSIYDVEVNGTSVVTSGGVAEIDLTDYISGTNDGTSWTSLTVNGVTKAIPAGGEPTPATPFISSLTAVKRDGTEIEEDDFETNGIEVIYMPTSLDFDTPADGNDYKVDVSQALNNDENVRWIIIRLTTDNPDIYISGITINNHNYVNDYSIDWVNSSLIIKELPIYIYNSSTLGSYTNIDENDFESANNEIIIRLGDDSYEEPVGESGEE